MLNEPILSRTMLLIVLCLISILSVGCQDLKVDATQRTHPVSEGMPTPSIIQVEIAGKMIEVDRIVSGYLCEDEWQGRIYVDHLVEVNSWDAEPDFFRGCSLVIHPGTVVYVAAHEGTKFYKGCSCHE